VSAKTKFTTNAFAAIHASASALHKINAISKSAMRDFDTACLVVPAEIKPQQIVGATDASSRDGQ
jgi:putative transcriptional regulator